MSASFIDTCIYCNFPTELCFCPHQSNKSKLVSEIREKSFKKKWVTEIIGSIDKEDFKTLKDKLGTGGKYFVDKIELRGKITDRCLDLLKKLGYHLCF